MRTDLIWFVIEPNQTEPLRPCCSIAPETRRDLWAAIRGLPQEVLPTPLYTTHLSSAEDGWKEREISMDGFDNPLYWVSFADLWGLHDREDMAQSGVNRAIWQRLHDYYAHKKPRIVLYWYPVKKGTRGRPFGSIVHTM